MAYREVEGRHAERRVGAEAEERREVVIARGRRHEQIVVSVHEDLVRVGVRVRVRAGVGVRVGVDGGVRARARVRVSRS